MEAQATIQVAKCQNLVAKAAADDDLISRLQADLACSSCSATSGAEGSAGHGGFDPKSPEAQEFAKENHQGLHVVRLRSVLSDLQGDKG